MGLEKRGKAFLVVLVIIFLAPQLFAQDNELGVYAELFRLGTVTPAINFVGVGGRASRRVHRNVQFEAELSYDFQRGFATSFSNGPTIAMVPSRMSTLNALFGPKFRTTGRRLQAFVTLKVGVLDFMVTRTSVPAGFMTAVNTALNGGTAGAFYPGAGVELFEGPVGLRAEVGDEIYFDNGGNSNLRVTVGPQFRF